MVVGDLSSISSFGGGRPSTSKESRVKSFVSGIVSPFTACWQPSIDACVPGCAAPPDFRYGKTSVISPLVDRLSPRHYHEASCSPKKSPHSYHPNSPLFPTSGGQPAPQLSDPEQITADIEKPHSNDVLCGRGGSSNRHLGNMNFRELVAANKKVYVGLTKKQKMMVARKIVNVVHSTEPPGRFLAKDLNTGLWYDIGVPRSLEKTSQALREKNSNDFPQDVSETASDFSVSSPRSDSGVSSPVSVEETNTKASRSSKNIEPPPLIIPPHLVNVFGHQKTHEVQLHSWHDYPPPDQSYMQSYPPHPSSSPSRDPYRMSPRPHSHHYAATPPRSPSHHYGSSPPYFYGNEAPQDYREHYEYYPKLSDHQERYAPHSPPPASSRSGRLPPPAAPPGHYRRYPPPTPPQIPTHHQHHYRKLNRRPLPPQPSTPTSRHTPTPYGHYNNHGHPPTPHPALMPSAAPSSSSPVIYRTHSNSYVRGKSEVSPERRQEWKRQRNEQGIVRRLSASSLSNAVEKSLTLDERVVGRERSPRELASPSGVLQSRSRRTLPPIKKSEKDDKNIEDLSGLAALSTAAFLLKLDES